MMQLDLATDAVSDRSDFGGTSQATELVASGDRSRIGIAVGNDPSGPVSVYASATDLFTTKYINSDANHVAADATGSRFLVSPNTPGFVHVLDSQANLLGTITGSDSAFGIALDAGGEIGYRSDSAGVHVLNTTTFLEESVIPAPGDFDNVRQMSLSQDGNFLLLNTNGAGIWVMPVTGNAAIVVNNAGDGADSNPGDGDCDTGSGACTLRAAIQEANASPGKDSITFTIGTGQQTISPATPLPEITEAVEIDGTTQPFFDQVLPLIRLDGSVVGGTSPGLSISGGDSTVRGLRIANFANAPGIELSGGGGNVIVQNFIGVDWWGSYAESNLHGIVISDSDDNLIGGATPDAVNTISANTGDGVQIENSAGNTVKGNFIGVDRFGNPLGNGTGVRILNSTNTVVGSTSGQKNTISGNVTGIVVEGAASTGNTFVGNYIGSRPGGSLPAPNTADGVLFIGASGNTIGGGNMILSNGQEGVRLLNSSINVLFGNRIGWTDLGNGSHGVLIHTAGGSSTGNQIGGTAPGEGNIIINNGGDGVRVVGPQATGNTIRGNALGANSGKGIENIAGGNIELAPPVVDNISPLTGTALPDCIVDVFSADDEDEGRFLYGTVTADGSGNWSFSDPSYIYGPRVSATCTDAGGNTSEFSNACQLDDYECDGVIDSLDNCPYDDNPGQEDTDGDLLGDVCDPCPANADCDGDGYTDGVEAKFIGTDPQDPCGTDGWPSDLVGSGFSFNRLDIVDLGSFVTPVRRFNTSPWDPEFSARWDLKPGASVGAYINVTDLAAMISGPTGYPPMFGGARAMGKTCVVAP
jgi:CSLREA domain-containing protein